MLVVVRREYLEPFDSMGGQVMLVLIGSVFAASGILILSRFMYFVPATVVGLIVLVTRYGGLRALRRAPADDQYRWRKVARIR